MIHSFMIRAIAIAVCLLSFIPVSGAVRHGLVIGLGEYKDKAWSKIHGDRDVTIIRRMLTDSGYGDIATLTNARATKAGILRAFAALADRCGKGDIVYIHFSGHGQQITDVSGDEEDGWDEAWIPYDAMYAYSRKYKGENHLVDDEIALWMTKITRKIGPEGKLLVVVDSCHSGDSLRDGDGAEAFYRGAEDYFVIPLATTPKRTPKTAETWVTISACRDYQANCEVRTDKGNFYGMLSFALWSHLQSLRKMDNNDILDTLQCFVDRHRRSLPQNVSLTGEGAKSIRISNFFK